MQQRGRLRGFLELRRRPGAAAGPSGNQTEGQHVQSLQAEENKEFQESERNPALNAQYLSTQPLSIYPNPVDPTIRELRAFFSCMAWRAIPGPLSKRKRRLDSLEAAQGAPRDPRPAWSPGKCPAQLGPG